MTFVPPGEVDTFTLLFEKLDTLLTESQDYYESFLDANNLYKKGGMTDKEFFQKLGDYVVAYSALEFLAVKTLFELKKAMKAGGNMQLPGMMGGQPGVNPMGGPPGIISGGNAISAFSQTGTLPSPIPTAQAAPTNNTAPQSNMCPSCGAHLKQSAKFCTQCGKKIIE
ncbi:MAG: zinc ribbon domain-containing protein [Cenarchaeum sp. SB0662_bin_33]|nr:zinc ribbon domain-containing protein [Cenarchaeum sp. SB0662_bin_33]